MNQDEEQIEDSVDEEKNDEIKNVLKAIYTQENVLAMHDEEGWETWLADTGASCHVTSNSTLLQDERPGYNNKIIVGDRRKCDVRCKGNLHLIKKDETQSFTLQNIRIVPEIGKSIISISMLLKEGGQLNGDNKRMTVTLNDVNLIFHKDQQDGLYYTRMKRIGKTLKCNAIYNDNAVKEDQAEWTKVDPHDKKKWPKMSRKEAHERWGHPHLIQLNKMAHHCKVNVYGILPKCAGCGLIKSRAIKTTRTCNRKATHNGERL